MKFDAQDCELVLKNQLTDTIFDFRLKNKFLAEMTKAGQFVQVLVPSKTLRRPISVCDVDGDMIRLVFEIRGEGTEILANTKVGEKINIIAAFKQSRVIPRMYHCSKPFNKLIILRFRLLRSEKVRFHKI